MRFRPRPTPTEFVTSPSDEPIHNDEPEVPLKAQTLLGTKTRINPSAAPRIATPEPLRELLSIDIRGDSLNAAAQESSNDTTPTTSQVMPWPSSAQRPNLSNTDVRTTSNSSGRKSAPSRNDSGQSVKPHQFYTEQKPAIESVYAGHYEPSKQPLYVSQQTSASAVRDMALRKGSPTVQEIASHSNHASKPLKSAMKQPKLQKDAPRTKKPKKLDIASLFPQPKAHASRSTASPAQYSHTPSPQVEGNYFFPSETVHAQVRRQGPNGRFETYKDIAAPSLESVSSKSTPRVKIFDADVYDETKLHKRRPPKGIQNWFDGFDISSEDDEEHKRPAVELPSETSPRPAQELPVEYVSHGAPRKGRGASTNRHSLLVPQEARRAPSRTQTNGKTRQQRAGSESSTLNGSMYDNTSIERRQMESRLAQSQLETESVLALSSEESDGERRERDPARDSRHIGQASTTVLQRPSIPPRKIHSKSSLMDEAIRKSSSTAQTSGSIPIRLTDSMVDIPPVPNNPLTSPRESNHVSSPRYRSSTQTTNQSNPKSPSHPPASPHPPKSAPSTNAETTTSSVPTDASHLMAVTDEEMMLLELMRKKRQAMQKNSFAEGYRLALKQEEEHLARRRSKAQGVVGRMVKQRDVGDEEDEVRRVSGGGRSKAEESVVSAGSEFESEVAGPGVRATGGRERRMRYSMIRKGSVDKEFKLGRFLAMDAAANAAAGAEDGAGASGHHVRGNTASPATLTRLERFLVMKPSLLDAVRDSRPVSGTEIEAETMTEEEDGTWDEGYTVDEDDVVDESGRIVRAAGLSPMQRLTEMARADEREGQFSPEHEIEEEEEGGRSNRESGVSGDATRNSDMEMDGRADMDEARTIYTQPSDNLSGVLSTGGFPAPPSNQQPPYLQPLGDDGNGNPTKRLSFVGPEITEDEPLSPDLPISRNDRAPRLPSLSQLFPPSRHGDEDVITPTLPLSAKTAQRIPSPLPTPTIHSSPPTQHRALTPLSPPPQPPGMRPTNSPSLSTSRPSPLTPSFGPTDRVDRAAIAISGSAGAESDGGSFRDPSIYLSSSPEPDHRNRSARHHFPSAAQNLQSPLHSASKPTRPKKVGAAGGMRIETGATRAAEMRAVTAAAAAAGRSGSAASGAYRNPGGVYPTTRGLHSGTDKVSPSEPSRTKGNAVAGGGGGVGMERVTSMSSFTSAGEDVLAAWKELGGGGEIGGGWGGGRRGW